MWPATQAWIVGYFTTSWAENSHNYAPPFPGWPHVWAVIPTTANGQNARVFAVRSSGSPVSGIGGSGSVTYSGITSSSWAQFDVVMTSSTTFVMALTDNNGNIKYSNNSGVSAFTIPVGRKIKAIKMTPTGSMIVVGETNTDGRAYISTDNSSVKFTLLPNSPVGEYKKIVTSDDGSIIFASISNVTTPLFYSTDTGSTWSVVMRNNTVNDISCTADGKFLFIHASDYVYNFNLTSGNLAPEEGIISSVVGNRLYGVMSADGKRRLSFGMGEYKYLGR
jgi:hypothetical protein